MILFILHDTLKYMIINMLELVKIMTDYGVVCFITDNDNDITNNELLEY